MGGILNSITPLMGGISRDGAALKGRSCAVNPPRWGYGGFFGMVFAYANGVPEKKEKKLV